MSPKAKGFLLGLAVGVAVSHFYTAKMAVDKGKD